MLDLARTRTSEVGAQLKIRRDVCSSASNERELCAKKTEKINTPEGLGLLNNLRIFDSITSDRAPGGEIPKCRQGTES